MHKATTRFWRHLEKLPKSVKEIAKKNFELLKISPLHPSLHFKKVSKFWSIRIGNNYRALAIKEGEDFIWVWIGSHNEYEKMIKGLK